MMIAFTLSNLLAERIINDNDDDDDEPTLHSVRLETSTDRISLFATMIATALPATVKPLTSSNEIDSTFRNLIYIILYCTVSIAAIGGNTIVIYLVIKFRKMRSVTDMFILNLAFGDLLMAILCIPFTFTANLLFHAWPFGSLMCRLVSYSQAVCVFTSAYTLVAISIDRYIAIIYPLRPRMTKRHCKLLIFLVWSVALMTPLPTALLSRLVLQTEVVEQHNYYQQQASKNYKINEENLTLESSIKLINSIDGDELYQSKYFVQNIPLSDSFRISRFVHFSLQLN